jgi:hypothetical protein
MNSSWGKNVIYRMAVEEIIMHRCKQLCGNWQGQDEKHVKEEALYVEVKRMSNPYC